MDSAEILLVGGPMDGKVMRIPSPGRPIQCAAIKKRGPFDSSDPRGAVETSLEMHTTSHIYRPLWIDPVNPVPTIYAHERLTNSEAITKLIAGYKV